MKQNNSSSAHKHALALLAEFQEIHFFNN